MRDGGHQLVLHLVERAFSQRDIVQEHAEESVVPGAGQAGRHLDAELAAHAVRHGARQSPVQHRQVAAGRKVCRARPRLAR